MTDDELAKYESFRATIDRSSFSNEPYMRRVEKPWGYEIHFTPDDLGYMGKILHVNEGAQLSLQAHDAKQESWFLSDGQMSVMLENKDGELEVIEMKPGVGYTCALGQRHRLIGGRGGGSVFEVSTPESGNTYRLEDDYSRTTETEAAREKRNREALKEE